MRNVALAPTLRMKGTVYHVTAMDIQRNALMVLASVLAVMEIQLEATVRPVVMATLEMLSEACLLPVLFALVRYLWSLTTLHSLVEDEVEWYVVSAEKIMLDGTVKDVLQDTMATH